MNRFTCQDCGISFEAVRSKRAYCDICKYGRNRRHGHSETREYATWTAMRERCSNPKAHNYHLYGARGIRVCERWDSFENFIADMGPRPKGYSIERENNDGNYEPSNCRWIPMAEQSRNRRNAYTADDDAKIREAVGRGYNYAQMAAFVGKTKGSVMGRAARLGLGSGQPPTPKKIVHLHQSGDPQP